MSDSDIDVKQAYSARSEPLGKVREGGIVVLAIGLNQTIDRTIRLDVLAPGQVLRAAEVAVTAGGKAVNVCRAASSLGAASTLVGLFPGARGQAAIELIGDEGIDVRGVPVDGEIRGTTVVIESSGRTTVINEPGPPLDADGWQRLLDVLGDTLGDELGARFIVAISGSAPPGTPPDAHRLLVDLVHGRGGLVAVDVTGARLLAAATAGADVVSPNLVEAEQALAGGPDADHHPVGESTDADIDVAAVAARARAAARGLVEAGAGAAVVSAGHHGVACHHPGLDEFIEAPSVDVVNPVGAGDALLGATLVALEQGRPFDVAVRHGVAYASASVAHAVAGYADVALATRLVARNGDMVHP